MNWKKWEKKHGRQILNIGGDFFKVVGAMESVWCAKIFYLLESTGVIIVHRKCIGDPDKKQVSDEKLTDQNNFAGQKRVGKRKHFLMHYISSDFSF